VDPNWTNLQQELRDGPFPNKGFTKQLQLQIEHKLGRKQTFSKFRILKLAGAGAVLLILLSLTRLDWSHSSNTLTASAPTSNTVFNENKLLAPDTQTRVQSVLLLGLRTDIKEIDSKKALAENNYSTYRTFVIAGDSKDKRQLQISAEGSGILIPHGQQFWKIDALTQETPNDIFHYLSAHPASKKTIKRNYAITQNEQFHHNEKLTYAGNNYVSIITAEEDLRGNAPIGFQTIWTRELEQINTAAGSFLNGIIKGKNDNTPVSLQKIFGSQVNNAIAQIKPQIDASQAGITSEITGENWTLVRQKGKWVPQIAEVETFNNKSATSFELHPFPLTLPDSIVSYDQLVCSWDVIKQVQPEAVDAVSSPDGDMIAILTADKLYVYPYGNNQIGSLALQVGLNKHESMVMAQWATAKYADTWLEAGKRYLKD
jgi:hypothetical protein